ncbi:hypothetical protein BDY24DRAFT_386502 [Mrakia frigida]|uniref:histidine--tRNA ligase n=1 Tax=Mrakia frigida TaxID=29902 RepID=UPI003FCC04B9
MPLRPSLFFPRLPLLRPLISSRPILRLMSTSTPPSDLVAEISALGDRIRTLKASKEPFAEEVVKLKELKAQLPPPPPKSAEQIKEESDKSVKQKKGANKGLGAHGKLVLKVPKGTKDFLPHETTVRKKIFSTLENIFVTHGASTIDTPVFELKDILSGKYGEDSKLIYDLQDQGGEICSLRYDLTVPFARFLAMNGITAMKRYHIAKVYRRDQPAISKGRLREFYQCDFDIAGVYDPMVPDAEILCILCEALEALEIGEFTVKINHRKILDGIFLLSGVPEASTRAISSAVDKLDKAPWSEVRREMVEEKGLDGAVADKIGEYVSLKGNGPALLARLESDAALNGIKTAVEGLADMKLLFQYLEIFGCLDRMSFDLSLARGLDYYTGLIYEAVTEASAPPPPSSSDSVTPAASTSAPKKEKVSTSATVDGAVDDLDESTVGVGSIAAGGRYDGLVGMFSSAASGGGKGDKGKMVVPCVGISVGVERVYAILMEKARLAKEAPRGKETEVYVMSVGDGLVKERMQICKQLWDAGIKAEFMYKVKPKNIKVQFDIVDRDAIPFAIIVGASEVEAGTVRIKEQWMTPEQIQASKEIDANGTLMKRTEMVGWLKERLTLRG